MNGNAKRISNPEAGQHSTGYKPASVPHAFKIINGRLKPVREAQEMEGTSASPIVEKNLIERIDYIQVSVTDLNASRDWYSRHFGFKEDFNDGKMCVMVPPQPAPSGLPMLILLPTGRQSNWITRGDGKQGIIGLHCTNVSELQAYLTEQSIETTDISDGGFAYFMSFFDPDGNMFEVIQLKKE